MSRRELSGTVRLDDLSEAQLEIIRGTVTGTLVARAGDLRHLNRAPDPRWTVKEVAALGRLASWLDRGEILVPDRTAWKVMSRIAREVDDMDEDLIERYEEAVAEHDALHALVARLGEVDPDA
jgi:hypothetical protein